MTCAKARVIATLTLPSGQIFTGENACANPQWVCPREEGDGYEKCKTVCGQAGHAEAMAMAAAGWNVRGGHMRVAYRHVCQDCRDEMSERGVTWELQDPLHPAAASVESQVTTPQTWPPVALVGSG